MRNATPAPKRESKKEQRRERMGNQDGLAEMSMPVSQAEPRCVADAAPTAAMAIPCETVAGASLYETLAWQAKA